MRVIDKDTGREFFLFNSEELKKETSAYWAVECAHSGAKLARVKYGNGSIHVREVCPSCGEFTGPTLKKSPSHDSLDIVDQQSIRKKHQKQREDGHTEIVQKHVRIQRKRDAGFQKEYINYLSSVGWKQKRNKVMERASFLCEGCKEKPATVVHHLTYARIYREMLFDLVALCHDCHTICHPDKVELSDEEVYSDDLPCFACRQHGEAEEGSWCNKFNVHTVIALVDSELCGPKASALEPLK